jgi:hypothetical protein
MQLHSCDILPRIKPFYLALKSSISIYHVYKFAWINDIAINDSHPDCKVNVLEYKEKDKKGKETTWVWVTDIPLCKDNVFKIMRG